MDLLKEEKRLIAEHNKALENMKRKKKSLKAAITIHHKAKKAYTTIRHDLRMIRKQIRVQGAGGFAVHETGVPLNEESAKLVDKIQKSTELADVEVEENTD